MFEILCFHQLNLIRFFILIINQLIHLISLIFFIIFQSIHFIIKST